MKTVMLDHRKINRTEQSDSESELPEDFKLIPLSFQATCQIDKADPRAQNFFHKPSPKLQRRQDGDRYIERVGCHQHTSPHMDLTK